MKNEASKIFFEVFFISNTIIRLKASLLDKQQMNE